MQAQRDAPPDMQCKDKFLVQSVVVSDGFLEQDISQDLVSNIEVIILVMHKILKEHYICLSI